MLHVLLAACAILVFVLAVPSRGQGPSPITPLSVTAEVGRDDGPPRFARKMTTPWFRGFPLDRRGPAAAQTAMGAAADEPINLPCHRRLWRSGPVFVGDLLESRRDC